MPTSRSSRRAGPAMIFARMSRWFVHAEADSLPWEAELLVRNHCSIYSLSLPDCLQTSGEKASTNSVQSMYSISTTKQLRLLWWEGLDARRKSLSATLKTGKSRKPKSDSSGTPGLDIAGCRITQSLSTL